MGATACCNWSGDNLADGDCDCDAGGGFWGDDAALPLVRAWSNAGHNAKATAPETIFARTLFLQRVILMAILQCPPLAGLPIQYVQTGRVLLNGNTNLSR